jgi:hypothetical protein
MSSRPRRPGLAPSAKLMTTIPAAQVMVDGKTLRWAVCDDGRAVYLLAAMTGAGAVGPSARSGTRPTSGSCRVHMVVHGTSQQLVWTVFNNHIRHHLNTRSKTSLIARSPNKSTNTFE